jgi:tRNA dimethylallyltransferase
MPEERSWLHTRIAERFTAMIGAGLIYEVQHLRQHYNLSAENPSMRCVGYRQVWDYLEDHHDRNLVLEKGIAATRQLAKRQLTWLRHWPHGQFFLINQTTNYREMIAFMRQITDN